MQKWKPSNKKFPLLHFCLSAAFKYLKTLVQCKHTHVCGTWRVKKMYQETTSTNSFKTYSKTPSFKVLCKALLKKSYSISLVTTPDCGRRMDWSKGLPQCSEGETGMPEHAQNKTEQKDCITSPIPTPTPIHTMAQPHVFQLLRKLWLLGGGMSLFRSLSGRNLIDSDFFCWEMKLMGNPPPHYQSY